MIKRSLAGPHHVTLCLLFLLSLWRGLIMCDTFQVSAPLGARLPLTLTEFINLHLYSLTHTHKSGAVGKVEKSRRETLWTSLVEMHHKLAQLCVLCVMLISADGKMQLMAQVSGSVLIVAKGLRALAASLSPLWGCTAGVRSQSSAAPISEREPPQWSDLLCCDCSGVGFTVFTWEFRAALHLEGGRVHTHARTRLFRYRRCTSAFNAWSVDADSGLFSPRWELRCVSSMTWSFFTVSLCTTSARIKPLRHDENTQIVPGGETLEGEWDIFSGTNVSPCFSQLFLNRSNYSSRQSVTKRLMGMCEDNAEPL